MEPYVGEIRLVGFNFAPLGWALCNGQLLSISENVVLFDLIGTTYGGNGTTNFALPDLQGRAAMHQGGSYVIGEIFGEEAVTVTTAQLPSHSHSLAANSALGTASSPGQHVLAEAPLGLGNIYAPSGSAALLSNSSVAPFGGNQPHENMMPSLTMNYIISLEGVFPSQ